jgi:hypothetical protein
MQKFKKQSTSKFTGHKSVKTPREMLHFLPFQIQKKRVNEKGEKMPVKTVKDYGNFILEFVEPEPITITDIKRLLGILKFFQDFEKDIIISEIPQAGQPPKIVYSLNNINFFKFCQNYTGAGKGNEKDVVESLSRLNNYVISRIEKANTINKIPSRYLYDYSIKQNIASFSILKAVFERIKEEGLIIKFDTLLKIKKNTAIALYLFLCGQNKQSFRESTLLNALNLENNKHSRELLRESFYQLRAVSFLSFRDDELIRKEPDGNHYLFIYFYTTTRP